MAGLGVMTIWAVLLIILVPRVRGRRFDYAGVGVAPPRWTPRMTELLGDLLFGLGMMKKAIDAFEDAISDVH